MRFVLAFCVLALFAAVEVDAVDAVEKPSTLFEDELLAPLEKIQTTLKRMKYAKADFDIWEAKLEALNLESDNIASAADVFMAAAETTGYTNEYTHN